MNCTDAAGVPEARAQELIDATTSAVYSHMSTILSADHHDLLAFLLALDRLRATCKVSDIEMSLLTGSALTETPRRFTVDDDGSPHWLSHKVCICRHVFASQFTSLFTFPTIYDANFTFTSMYL